MGNVILQTSRHTLAKGRPQKSVGPFFFFGVKYVPFYSDGQGYCRMFGLFEFKGRPFHPALMDYST